MAIDNELIRNNPTKRALEAVEGTHQKREALTRKQQEGLLSYLYKHDRDIYRKVSDWYDVPGERICRIDMGRHRHEKQNHNHRPSIAV